MKKLLAAKAKFTGLLVCVGALALTGTGQTASPQSKLKHKRIITIGGSITEVVYQLGAFNQIVGTDTSSIYPPQANNLPKVGYWMRLSTEGILSLKPDLVLASKQAARRPAVFNSLKTAGVQVVLVDDEPSEKGAYAKIRQIGAVLGKKAKAEQVINTVQKGLAASRKRLAGVTARPRVLFVYARGRKTLLVAGQNTPADAMIRLAGGRNTITGFEGFKPLVPEAVVKAAPDYVVMLSGGVGSLGGAAGVWNLPGLKLTPAAQRGALVVMDDLLLLGFAGRLHTGVDTLAKHLHKW